MAVLQHLNDGTIQQLAKVLGDTDSGFSGSEISALFRATGLRDSSRESTKWKRIYGTLSNAVGRKRAPEPVERFIETAMEPVRYRGAPALFLDRQRQINHILSFHACRIGDDGKLHAGAAATTLDEAAQIADSLVTELERRETHRQALRFCETELLQNDLFHGVHEATKSILNRLREASGLGSDGDDLITECFKKGDGLPLIVINDYQTDSDISEHTGFANLLRGVVGHWRNPTAHRTRIDTDILIHDILDAMSTISYIHRVLDNARNIHTDKPV